MEAIKDLFGAKRYLNPKGKLLTERGVLMQEFVTRLNIFREGKYELLDMPRMGRILQGIPTKDLYAFMDSCNRSKNFSTKFWWELDIENHGGVDKVLLTYPKR